MNVVEMGYSNADFTLAAELLDVVPTAWVVNRQVNPGRCVVYRDVLNPELPVGFNVAKPDPAAAFPYGFPVVPDS